MEFGEAVKLAKDINKANTEYTDRLEELLLQMSDKMDTTNDILKDVAAQEVNNVTYSIPSSRITTYAYDNFVSYADGKRILAKIDLSGINLEKFNYLIYQHEREEGYSSAPPVCERYIDFKNNATSVFAYEGVVVYGDTLIVSEKDGFTVICGDGINYSTYHEDYYNNYILGTFKSAIPYFKLV